jgi:hypothetical protein
VKSRTDRGYDGCWTLAMGFNEAANQNVGGIVPLTQRAKDSWYVPDKTHFATAGYTQRAARIADALAYAVPADCSRP